MFAVQQQVVGPDVYVRPEFHTSSVGGILGSSWSLR